MSQSESRPLLKVTGVEGMPMAMVERALGEMLNTVRFRTTFSLEPCRGGFWIKCGDNRAEDIFLKYGGLLLSTGHRPQFSFMEQKMSLQEVFAFVTQHLQANERSDHVGKMHGEWEPKSGGKKEKEPTYAIRAISSAPPEPPVMTPTPALVATPVRTDPPVVPKPTPAPVLSAWNTGYKGYKGKGDSTQTYKGYESGKGYATERGAAVANAGRGPP